MLIVLTSVTTFSTYFSSALHTELKYAEIWRNELKKGDARPKNKTFDSPQNRILQLKINKFKKTMFRGEGIFYENRFYC